MVWPCEREEKLSSLNIKLVREFRTMERQAKEKKDGNFRLQNREI